MPRVPRLAESSLLSLCRCHRLQGHSSKARQVIFWKRLPYPRPCCGPDAIAPEAQEAKSEIPRNLEEKGHDLAKKALKASGVANKLKTEMEANKYGKDLVAELLACEERFKSFGCISV